MDIRIITPLCFCRLQCITIDSSDDPVFSLFCKGNCAGIYFFIKQAEIQRDRAGVPGYGDRGGVEVKLFSTITSATVDHIKLAVHF